MLLCLVAKHLMRKRVRELHPHTGMLPSNTKCQHHDRHCCTKPLCSAFHTSLHHKQVNEVLKWHILCLYMPVAAFTRAAQEARSPYQYCCPQNVRLCRASVATCYCLSVAGLSRIIYRSLDAEDVCGSVFREEGVPFLDSICLHHIYLNTYQHEHEQEQVERDVADV